MELVHDVSSPVFICDTFTERRLRGNPCAVCFCPTSVYCAGWSEISSLEASCGRGEPTLGHVCLNKDEQEKKDAAYAEERDRIMGNAFQKVASEMHLSETCFVYRLPASRIRAIKELIRHKLQEFDQEHAEKRRKEEEAMEAELLKQAEGFNPNGLDQMGSPKTIFSGGLIPSASFLGCLESSTLGSSMIRSRASKKIQVQWFGLRWFTPKGESFMCGHGTLAAAHCLFECSRLARLESTKRVIADVPGEFFMPSKTDVICFVTDLGIVTVRKHEVMEGASNIIVSKMLNHEKSLNLGGSMNVNPGSNPACACSGPGLVESYRVRDPMDPGHAIRDAYEVHFPSHDPASVLELLPRRFMDDAKRAFGFNPQEVEIEDICLATGLQTYLLRFKNVHNVMAAVPNEILLRDMFQTHEFLEALEAHPRLLREPQGIVITAQNPANNKEYLPNKSLTLDDSNALLHGRGSDGQVISRFFEPWAGVLEDPVSGSVHTMLAPYWLRVLGNNNVYHVGDKIVCYQASSRGGYVPCIIIGRDADRVALQGTCVTSLRGTVTYEVED
eukprot:gene11198-7772_t